MKVKILKSPNCSSKKRNRSEIRFVIIHYTGMQSERESIKRLSNERSKVSAHYIINRKGHLLKMVEENRVAWHAGKSRWKHFINLNNRSIGIELVNKGHTFGYENFSKKQIDKLIQLCKFLIKKYKIKQKNILGHSDIAPLRKIDPGEKFPWKLLSKKKIGYWHNFDKKNNKIYDFKKENLRNYFFNNLYKIGYRYFDKRKSSNSDAKIIKAFQRRFRQNKINGKIDKECMQISYYLAHFLKN
ncbi:N-acetylmuramoyl-L-alanine amidase [Pelagibacteraceae bacterium]|nr:N-acetylmuramoyl-L-alanine amidase [Pelagibacteraceae bacterium]